MTEVRPAILGASRQEDVLATSRAVEVHGSGRGRSLSPMPGRHALASMNGDTVTRREDVEALVLTAYGYAMS